MMSSKDSLEAISTLGIRFVAVENHSGDFYIYYQLACGRYEVLMDDERQYPMQVTRQHVSELFRKSENITILTKPPGFTSKQFKRLMEMAPKPSVGQKGSGDEILKSNHPLPQGGGDPPPPRVNAVITALDALYSLLYPDDDEASERKAESSAS